jgi:geranylgeranyl pyrophosphate synthase
MTGDPDFVENCIGIFRKLGKDALEKARKEILDSPNDGGVVSSALKHFARVTLRNALPVFSALVSLSCEAAGGKPEKTVGVGAALLLIAGAADVHDDIIDKSAEKYNKKTVYGKFGADIALLVGDALLIQGLTLLHRECNTFPEEQKQKILILVNDAFFKISKAEAKEAVLKGKFDIPPEKYLEILRLKCVVPQVHCQIGAVVAGANSEVIFKMGEFGKTYGFILSIVEEFADLFSSDELENRIRNECPPLPLLYAMKNPVVRHEVLQLTSSATIGEANLKRIADIVIGLKEVQEICRKMNINSQKQTKRLYFLEKEIRDELASLLLVLTVSLQQYINRACC